MIPRTLPVSPTLTLTEFLPGRYSLHSSVTGALVHILDDETIRGMAAARMTWEYQDAHPVEWTEPEPLPEMVQKEMSL